MKSVALLMLSGWLLCESALAAEPLDVFFLAVGSGNYISPPEAGVQHFNGIPGAVKSAETVAELLRKGGAKFGLIVTSDRTHFVSQDDVYKAFPAIWDEMVKAKTRRALVVVYIAAHGIADGYTWAEYILPGNFAHRGDDFLTKHGVEMAEKTIFVPTIVEYLNGWKQPFLLLLDTCYEGNEYIYQWNPIVPDLNAACPPDDIISFCAQMSKGMESVRKFEDQRAHAENSFIQMFASMREANKFSNTFPVMFSTEPGKRVPTVADPLDPDARATAVAPLARRIMLIVPPALGARQPLTLGSFLRAMASPKLDAVTSPGVIYSPVPAGADEAYLIDSTSSESGRVERRLGTATTPAICCTGKF
jgi:hypothetical protein